MKFIVIKAFTDSEYDYCDYALIKYSENFIEEIVKYLKNIPNESFIKASFRTPICDFYCFDNEIITEQNIIEKPYIIELSEEELNKLNVPESILELYRYHVYKEGSIYFSAYGKYTGEEFFTKEFNIQDVKNG